MVQPPPGEQSEQPSLLDQQPPHDPARPSDGQAYGQQSYGPPPDGTDGDQPPPVKRDNGFAVAGISLAIVPPLGLIFSIIGLTKSKALAGTGKTLSIAGIVVSLLVGAGTGTVIAIAGPAPVDPGCTAFESLSGPMAKIVGADEAAISRDQNNLSALRADLRHLVVDIQLVETRATTAEAQAQNQPVRAALLALIRDLKTLTSGIQAMLNGDLSQVIQVVAAADKLGSDGNAVESTCSAVDGPNLQ